MRKDDGFENDLNQQKKLFIGGLHWKTEDSDLREYFSKKGTVTDAMVHIYLFIPIFMVFRSSRSQIQTDHVVSVSLFSAMLKMQKVFLKKKNDTE